MPVHIRVTCEIIFFDKKIGCLCIGGSTSFFFCIGRPNQNITFAILDRLLHLVLSGVSLITHFSRHDASALQYEKGHVEGKFTVSELQPSLSTRSIIV